jgi:comEA protein
MYLTKAQIKALWFLVAILTITLVIQYVMILLSDQTAYDFSDFDREFFKKRDSILTIDSVYQNKPLAVFENNFSLQTIQTIQFPININSASIKELESLPRIGPKLAERIIKFRYEQGLFQVKEDLKKVKGIGDKTFEQLKDLIVVE